MTKSTRFVIGMDIGDRKIHACVLERATGEITAEGVIGTGRTDVEFFFRDLERAPRRAAPAQRRDPRRVQSARRPC